MKHKPQKRHRNKELVTTNEVFRKMQTQLQGERPEVHGQPIKGQRSNSKHPRGGPRLVPANRQREMSQRRIGHFCDFGQH